jgi:hypothetical protein
MNKLIAVALAAIAAMAVLVYLYFGAPTGSANLPQPPVTEPSAEERQLMKECYANNQRRKQLEQVARDAESKDPVWAGAMEQKLREFTAQRFQLSKIEILGIDCKSTFCELKAQSSTPEAAAQFEEGMNVLWQPPGDFRAMSASRSAQPEKTLHTVLLKRRTSSATAHEDDDQHDSACSKMVDMRVQRELGALWTQPRDADWAEPMEQSLRQRLAKQLEKNPIENLEIHCKTTVCRITARGTTAVSRAAFIEAADAIIDGRWARKRLRIKAALPGDSQGGQWTYEFTLVRI